MSSVMNKNMFIHNFIYTISILMYNLNLYSWESTVKYYIYIRIPSSYAALDICIDSMMVAMLSLNYNMLL